MSEDSYRFVAQAPATATDPEAWVILNICTQDELCTKLLSGVWEKMFTALRNFHEHTADDNGPAPGWVHWKLSDWSRDKKIVQRQKFAAWAGSSLVGILNTRPAYPSYIDPNKKVLYIEHIATSPGNLVTDIWRDRFRHVGNSLMAYAVLQSKIQGFEGIIGLHAADDKAANYYRHLKERHRFFHEPLRGIAGTPEDRSAKDKLYFESIPEQAINYLEGYRCE